MVKKESEQSVNSKESHTFLLILLRIVTASCALLVVVPYVNIGWFVSLQSVAGQQILRVLLLALVVLQTGHWLLAERRKEFLISAILFAVLLFEILHTVPLRTNVPDSPPTLRVMTFNSQALSAGGWVSWMDQEDVDLACIQEIRGGDVEYIRSLAKKHGFQYLHIEFTSDSSDGLALISRIPFENTEFIRVPEHENRGRSLPIVQIEVDGTIIHVLGVHLASTPRSSHLDGVGEAWKIREKQVESIINWVNSMDGPTLVLGDFNATPTDGLIRKLRDHLTDMWVKGGSGVGGTWPAGLAFLRIDMVLTNGFEGMSDYGLKPISASDHLSLSMTLHLDEE
jgi:endonuclease/exonuclease/phosphatase family metal-dependent hydrolase